MKHGKKGVGRITAAFRNSYDGFVSVFRSEEAFRQELLLFFLLSVTVFVIDFALVERLFLLSAIFFVLFAELVNTAIELTIDRISAELHPLSKTSKDVGSLMVLLSFVYGVTVWGMVLWAKFGQ